MLKKSVQQGRSERSLL